MEFHAYISYLRIAPRKVRLVAGLLRGKRVDQALHQLQVLHKGSSKPLRKLLLSAVANASQKEKKAEDLYVHSLIVNEGPRLKRYRPRAFGRAAEILKRSSHVALTLTDSPKTGKKSKLPQNAANPKKASAKPAPENAAKKKQAKKEDKASITKKTAKASAKQTPEIKTTT